MSVGVGQAIKALFMYRCEMWLGNKTVAYEYMRKTFAVSLLCQEEEKRKRPVLKSQREVLKFLKSSREGQGQPVDFCHIYS